MLFLFQGCLRLSFKNWTGLRCGLTMDRIAGLQDLQDRVLMLSRALTMDRIAGLQDLQDRLFWLSCGLTMDRMEGWQVLQKRLFLN